MSAGLPYDSDAGRNLSAAITALMCGQAYLTSAEIAEAMGPFPRYRMNRKPFLEVIEMHKDGGRRDPGRTACRAICTRRRARAGREALERGPPHGYKNAQVTVLAPTGTIAFMMDCDTTGVEPDIALVKYKKLVGGGFLKIVNQTVPMALRKLGYSEAAGRRDRRLHRRARDDRGRAGADATSTSPVFDCAFRAREGHAHHPLDGPRAHDGRRAALPLGRDLEDREPARGRDASTTSMHAYIEGWQLGLKALAVYRDGSKRTQPLNAGHEQEPRCARSRRRGRSARKLPDERTARTHKFSIAGHEGYLTVGLYDDGQPGEIFLQMAKEGSTVSGLMDTIATMTSIALQYGVPLKALVDKFSHTRFEPVGLHEQPRDPDREVGDGLRVPLPRQPLPARRGQVIGRAGDRRRGLPVSRAATLPRAAVAGGSGADPRAATRIRQPGRRARRAATAARS